MTFEGDQISDNQGKRNREISISEMLYFSSIGVQMLYSSSIGVHLGQLYKLFKENIYQKDKYLRVPFSAEGLSPRLFFELLIPLEVGTAPRAASEISDIEEISKKIDELIEKIEKERREFIFEATLAPMVVLARVSMRTSALLLSLIDAASTALVLLIISLASMDDKALARVLEAIDCCVGRLPKVENECLQLLLEDFVGTIRYMVGRLQELKSSDEQTSFEAAEELAREILKSIDRRIRKCEACILLEENPMNLISIFGEFLECLRNSFDEIKAQLPVQGIDAQQSPGEIQG